MNFSNKLRKLREDKNLSLQQLATKIDVSKTVIWQYENKNSIPSSEVIKKIAIFFNVTTDYLIFENTEKEDMVKISDPTINEKINKILKLDPKYRDFLQNTLDFILEKNKKTE